MGGALPAILGSEHALVFADDVQRCKDSAAALGLNVTDVQVDQALFDPLSANLPSCRQPDWKGTVVGQVLKSGGPISKAQKLLPRVQEKLGRGAAPPLDRIPNIVSHGYYIGGLRVASESIVETFELEKFSSMTVAWGNLSDAEFIDFSYLRNTYFATMYGGRDIAQRYASGILSKLTTDLPPATVLLGHDLNLQAIRSLLHLEWQCGTWAADSMPPLSGILFTVTESGVRVQSVCPSLTESEPVAVGAASFRGGRNEMPAKDFSSLALSAIEWQCVNSSHADDPSIMFI